MMNEDDIRGNLQESRKWIDSKEALTVKELLEKIFFSNDIKVFVLHHHYGQVEEYFTLIVNGASIVELESAGNEIVGYDIYPLDTYLADNKKMPKTFRRTIDIAIQLAKE